MAARSSLGFSFVAVFREPVSRQLDFQLPVEINWPISMYPNFVHGRSRIAYVNRSGLLGWKGNPSMLYVSPVQEFKCKLKSVDLDRVAVNPKSSKETCAHS